MSCLRLAGAALADRGKPAPAETFQWEGEKADINAQGPGFGMPVPKLEDRFPADKVEKQKE